jgi:hypothetical protein
MNRLIGAVDSDVTSREKKIAVVARTILGINSGAEVDLLDTMITSTEAEVGVSKADVVFGCLDGDLPRLALTGLCARYAKPLFDLASDTLLEDDGLRYGGRVVFANGSGCLVCRDLLDQEEVAADGLAPQQRLAYERIYGVARGALAGTGPMVVSVNGIVASAAVTEFMVFVTGIRPPAAQIIYRGEVPSLRRVTEEPEPDCYFCKGIWGSK